MAHFESLARLLNASPVLTGISGCSRIWCFPASALVSVPFATSISMSAIIAAAVAVAATVCASVSAAVTAISVSIAAAVVSSAITAVIPVTVAAAVVPSAITAVIPVTVAAAIAAAIALSDSNPNTSGLQELDSDQRNHGPSDHGKGEEVLKHVSSCTHSVLHICRPAGMDANQLSLRRLPEFGSVEN
ncbi:hypothetical protein [Agrobacterium pusense]|uniref:hypothetical protein n=1 Tax=Agrobacterium pusense TaxID=648995 RepID=UPI00143F6247|nr:hypothetical protein [Agrobacterium pusense]